MIVSVDHTKQSAEQLLELIREKRTFCPISKDISDTMKSSVVRALDHLGSVTLESGTVIVFTAGTTAQPKGILLTPENLHAAARAFFRAHNLKSGDRWVLSLPTHHISGLSVLFRSTLLDGAPVFPKTRSLEAVLECAISERATGISLVPTQLQALMNFDQSKFDKLRHCKILIGGAPLSGRIREQAESKGLKIYESYGATETAAQVVNDGVIHAGAELVCSDVGEVLVRGPMVARQYVTEEGIFSNLDADGFWHSGDLGQISQDGTLRISGRIKDLIISGGVNVSPVFVEREIMSFTGVLDAAVFGVPDDKWGQAVSAFVVAQPGFSIKQLQERLEASLDAANTPKNIILVDEIPRNVNGKISRSLLAEEFMLRLQSKCDEKQYH